MLEKRNIYFMDRFGDYRLLERNVTKDEVMKIINKFLEEHEFKSYYTRTWETDRGTMYDVGSHSEFFLWGGV